MKYKYINQNIHTKCSGNSELITILNTEYIFEVTDITKIKTGIITGKIIIHSNNANLDSYCKFNCRKIRQRDFLESKIEPRLNEFSSQFNDKYFSVEVLPSGEIIKLKMYSSITNEEVEFFEIYNGKKIETRDSYIYIFKKIFLPNNLPLTKSINYNKNDYIFLGDNIYYIKNIRLTSKINNIANYRTQSQVEVVDPVRLGITFSGIENGSFKVDLSTNTLIKSNSVFTLESKLKSGYTKRLEIEIITYKESIEII